MGQELRVLMVEDVASDAELAERELKRAGLAVRTRRVEREEDFRREVGEFRPHVILSDFSMPQFNGMSAPRIAREIVPDVPFIFVSGTLGEDYAIRALKNGATDYVLKTNLVRLPPTIERAVSEAAARAERRREEQLLALEHTVVRHIAGADSASVGLKAIIRAICESERWDVGRYFRADEKAGVLRFSEAWSVAGSDIERFIEKSRDIRYAPGVGPAGQVWQSGQPLWVADITRDSRIEEAGLARNAGLHGGFVFPVNAEGNRVKPMAWDGGGEDYIGMIPLGLDEKAPGDYGLAGRAVKERKAMIVDDMTADPRITLRKETLERGFRSLAILPLLVAEEPAGVLALYADSPGFFGAEDEMRLLLELAGDIAFALEHIEKAEQLNYLAYYDPLTGLANATLFRERLARFVDAARGAGHKLALGSVAGDRFKTINDSLGRPAGDELLKQIARRISEYVKDPSELARVAADRFAVVLARIDREDDVARLTEQRLAQCFGTPFRVGEAELRISAKVGLSVFPNDGTDADTLFKNAEAALKKAKETNERYLFYTHQLTERIAERLSLENKLRQALERQEFVLHYQPRVETDTRRVIGVEALIRWMSPERGLVQPLEFIPLLEETGLILEVGGWALEQAVRDHAHWLQQGIVAPRIA